MLVGRAEGHSLSTATLSIFLLCSVSVFYLETRRVVWCRAGHAVREPARRKVGWGQMGAVQTDEAAPEGHEGGDCCRCPAQVLGWLMRNHSPRQCPCPEGGRLWIQSPVVSPAHRQVESGPRDRTRFGDEKCFRAQAKRSSPAGGPGKALTTPGLWVPP